MKGCCAATRATIAQEIERRALAEQNPQIKLGLIIAKNIVKAPK